MRPTVTDTKEQPIYQKEDFLPHFKPQDVTIIRVAENKNFDGSIIREVPSDTTHLLMRYMDRINKKDLERLPHLKYVGITSTGWWDMYFDRFTTTFGLGFCIPDILSQILFPKLILRKG